MQLPAVRPDSTPKRIRTRVKYSRTSWPFVPARVSKNGTGFLVVAGVTALVALIGLLPNQFYEKTREKTRDLKLRVPNVSQLIKQVAP
jgi:hypothetical protein